MTITVGGTNITFSDSTTQGSASGPYVGYKGQIFTASGTFTVPTGVTAVKITAVGPGGAGGTNYSGGAAAGNTSFGAYVVANGGGGSSYYGNNPGAGGTASGTSSPQAFNGSAGGTTGCFGGGAGGPAGALIYITYGYGCGGQNGSNASGGGGGAVAVGYVTGLTSGGSVSVTIGAVGSSGAGSGQPGIVYVEW